MSAFYDDVGFTAASSGTADFVFSARIAGYNSDADANMATGPVAYRAFTPGNAQFEIGIGTYTSGTHTITRTTVYYNSSQTGTKSPGQSGAGTKISFSVAPTVVIVALAQDLLGIDQANSWTTTQKAQAQANINVSGPTVTKLTSGTAQTYTTPTNCTWIRIRMVGGGSGASGSGTSGGNAGTPTASTWSGGSLSAGGAAQGQQLAAGNAGGTASGGNVANIGGAAGLIGSISGGGNAAGAAGGSSAFGGAGGGKFGAITGGNASTNSGCGGGCGGISNTVTPGASGGAGAYVEHIIVGPAASYTYTVGAGSTGGSAGTSGAAGGNGAAGMIIVEEYYN